MSNSLSKRQIALVHVAKNKTGMVEAEYRDLLASFGATSSKDLPPNKFEALMQQFEKLGFKSKKSARPLTPYEGKQKMLAKVTAILKDLNLSKAYADSMAKNMFSIDRVEFLTPAQLHKLVAALAYHQNRRKRKGGNTMAKTTKKRRPEMKITVDFKDDSELYNWIKDKAKTKRRTPGNQLIYFLAPLLEAQKEGQA